MNAVTVDEAEVLLRTVGSHYLSSLTRLSETDRYRLFDAADWRCQTCGHELEWGTPKSDPRHPEVAHTPAVADWDAATLSRYSQSDPLDTGLVSASCHECNQRARGFYRSPLSRPVDPVEADGDGVITLPPMHRYGAVGLVVSAAVGIRGAIEAAAARQHQYQGRHVSPSSAPLAVRAPGSCECGAVGMAGVAHDCPIVKARLRDRARRAVA